MHNTNPLVFDVSESTPAAAMSKEDEEVAGVMNQQEDKLTNSQQPNGEDQVDNIPMNHLKPLTNKTNTTPLTSDDEQRKILPLHPCFPYCTYKYMCLLLLPLMLLLLSSFSSSISSIAFIIVFIIIATSFRRSQLLSSSSSSCRDTETPVSFLLPHTCT